VDVEDRDKPVTYPDDPNQVYWEYTAGNELRDPTMKESADYYARLLSWYEKAASPTSSASGTSPDITTSLRTGSCEIDRLRAPWSPEAYTKFYDAVTAGC